MSKSLFVGLLILLLILVCGCTSSNSATSDVIEVSIDYNGSWKGLIEYNNGRFSIEGAGDISIPIPDATMGVSATFRKWDSSSNELTVKMVKNGNVIEQQSTNASFGVASVSLPPIYGPISS